MFEYFLIVSILMGLITGSFTNVMIYRIPEKKSLWYPPSACGNCGAGIKWYDNIPVLSYLILKGKCRNCGSGISIQYPLVELLCGILYAVMYLVFGLNLDLLFMAVISIILVAISMIDIKTMTIPNGLVIALFITGILYSGTRLLFPDMFSQTMMWFEPLIGFFAASLLLLLVAVLSKGGMGGGDIKLMAAAGIFLGWKGVLLALVSGSLLGAVISIILIIAGKKGRKDMIPFGPFLCVGIMFAALFATTVLDWYIGLFTR
ncbi:MAG: prepilin peptidase [Clostridia bacterium]|nr:prepilin peptidase [Clostridia bacterium]